MSKKYIIAKNVIAEYDAYVFEQKVKKEQYGEVDMLNFKDRLEYKLIQDKVSRDVIKKAVAPVSEKKKFLDFVYLSRDEYDTLAKDYGDKTIKSTILRLNDYIGSKWDKYKSHYYVILTWLRNSGTKKLSPKEHTSPVLEKPQTEEDKKRAQEILQKARNVLTSQN